MRWILTFALVMMASPVMAMPGWGENCSNCHTAARANAVQVDGQGILNLDGQRNDGLVRGDLQVFTASPGDTVSLAVTALDGSDAFSVQLKRLGTDGVIGAVGDTLAGFVADASWVDQGTYFTDTGWGTPWTGVTPMVYSLTLDPNTPLNVYDLEFAIAGKGVDGKFYGDEHFLLNVVSGIPPVEVPEPTTLVLMFAGLIGVALLRR